MYIYIYTYIVCTIAEISIITIICTVFASTCMWSPENERADYQIKHMGVIHATNVCLV